MRKSPRQRRLEADFRSVEKLDAESSVFSFLASGEPPNRYRLQFTGPGISKNSFGEIQVTQQHEVIVELGAAYPRMVPNLLWQTPIFHPNISNNGVVCLGGYGTHWVPSLTLDEMSTMLWDMIRYENFDIQSPYNREAALWARDQRHFKFPLDDRDIRDRINAPVTELRSNVDPQPASAPPKGKSMLGAIGSLADRFRNRSSNEDADSSEQISEPRISAEANANAVSTASTDSSSGRILVDPSEIEVIEEGITFLDSVETEVEQRPDPPTIVAEIAEEPEEDTGITFLN